MIHVKEDNPSSDDFKYTLRAKLLKEDPTIVIPALWKTAEEGDSQLKPEVLEPKIRV